MRTNSLCRTLLVVALMGGARASAAIDLPIHDGIGGDFSAPSSIGRELRSAELRGKPLFLFFGYTSCPDVCPATLAHLKALMKHLGPVADRVHVLLVTVDPENDTAEHLREYLGRFDPRFVGVTGTREQIDRIARLFLVDYRRSHGIQVSTEYNPVPASAKQSYLYTHSQQIYLIDAVGRTRALFFSGSPLEEMKKAVLALLDEAKRESGTGAPGAGSPDHVIERRRPGATEEEK